ncbi:MAG: hypothetical protein ACYC3V_17940 [Chloroflexota bacterium]
MHPDTTSRDNSSRSGRKDRSTRYLQRFFLARLQRMVAVRREQDPEAGDPNLRLLDKAVYSTFCDCLDLGAGDEARAALRHEPVDLRGKPSPEVDSN